MTCQVDVTLRIDDSGRTPDTVRGELRSRYGRHGFSGWLELLGHLETIVDRATEDAHAVQRPAEGRR